MKRFFAPLLVLALPVFTTAQDLPAPSPAATVMQRVGLVDITITYSRPSVKGRRIFGDLVPYGQIWRTGANHCPVLETTGPIVLSGQTLPAGKYALLTIPGQDAWEVVVNKNADLSGTSGYNREEDVLRTKATVRQAPPTESFTIAFENLGNDRAELVFRWEKQEAVVMVDANSTDQAIKNIKEALADPKADYRAYARSAGFYLDRNMEVKTALQWAEKSVSMEKKYWNTFTLARAQAAVGMYADATTTGREAAELARAEKDDSAAKTYQEKVQQWSSRPDGK